MPICYLFKYYFCMYFYVFFVLFFCFFIKTNDTYLSPDSRFVKMIWKKSRKIRFWKWGKKSMITLNRLLGRLIAPGRRILRTCWGKIVKWDWSWLLCREKWGRILIKLINFGEWNWMSWGWVARIWVVWLFIIYHWRVANA